MLKRYQVLLPVWQEEFLREIAGEHDMSFSEMVRVCGAVAITQGFKKIVVKGEQERRKNIDNLMYAARKAAEKSMPGVPAGR